jgi:hypothetical protein
VKVAALGVDQTTNLGRALSFPFADDHGLAIQFGQSAQHVGKRLSRWLFEREDLDVPVVKTQRVAMAFKM